MVVYSFTTGNLFIEYLKEDGENLIWTVAIDYFPIIKQRKDVTIEVLYNHAASILIHGYIEDYEDFILRECMNDYNEEKQSSYANDNSN